MNILAIGAHGDDLEAYCGGTLAKFRQQQHHVFMCVVTDGRGRPKGDPDLIIPLRRAESIASAAIIGAEALNLNIPDGDLWFNPPTRHLFVELIRQTKPDLIITHPPDDYHPDHKATSQLVMDAVQIARTNNYPSALAPHREIVPVAFMDSERGIGFIPQDYVDITDVWDIKVQMLNQHRSQIMPPDRYDPDYVVPPNDRNPFYHMIEIMSGFRGFAASVRYAEGFRWWHAANRIPTRRILP